MDIIFQEKLDNLINSARDLQVSSLQEALAGLNHSRDVLGDINEHGNLVINLEMAFV